MSAAGLRIRRAKRTDFTAVMRLLAEAGQAIPPSDRATLRRFRNIVADLGGDFYLALVDGALAGLVHVTYARHLTLPPLARLDQLVVAESYRRRGAGTALLGLARRRARQRGCTSLSCALASDRSPAQAFLEKAGMRPAGVRYQLDLGGGGQV
jgi:GNAT superfamily N-acetyltransferase